MTIQAGEVVGVLRSVTRPWTRQRKAEESSLRQIVSRGETFSARVDCAEIVSNFLPEAYAHASGNGKYTVSKRQLYYACREEVKKWTGKALNANYFSNTLLVQYINRHPETTASWKITADPRGTLTVPNAHYEVRIPVGTLAIEDHLRVAISPVGVMDLDANVPIDWPSLRHGERYQAVLYIEKEGFQPLLEEAAIAERFDLAILSCKGQSVVAARRFVDEVCSIDGGVPLFVVHDFDKAGFEISQQLTSVSRSAEESDRVAYQFKNRINVKDLGLRLTDVQQYRLGAETVDFRGQFAADSITTPEEQAFLRSGRRVELNAFTSPRFIEWLESKLRQHGLKDRLIPDDDTLNAAYRRAVAVANINRQTTGLIRNSVQIAERTAVPKTLLQQLKQEMKRRPDEAWDKALYRLARRKLGFEGVK